MSFLGHHFLNQDNSVDTVDFFSFVLLVDSDEQERSEIASILESLVGDVAQASSGQEALDVIETQYIELVIVSLDLQDISGAALLSTIDHYRPGLPVIVLSKAETLEDALHALREGAWDYIINGGRQSLEEQASASLQRVAERKLAELRDVELRTERNAFWSAVQTAQDGLTIVSPSGLATFANPAFQDFIFYLGGTWSTEEPVNLLELIAMHDRALAEQFGAALRGQRSGDSLWTSELRIVNAQMIEGPGERYFQLNLSSLQLGQGPASGLAMINESRQVLWVSDITQRKEHEKFQRDVISTTSHDLKGPLSTISCAAELISETDESLSPDTVQMVQRIYSASRKALNHIEEFLSARRIEDGMMKVEVGPIPIVELFEDLAADYGMVAQNKGQQLEWLVEDANAVIFADRMAISRVLGNLITNAIKFTPEGGQIQLVGQRFGDMMRIAVTDTGPGIEPQARRTLFDRYSRLKQHKQIEGSGLGLFIVKSIVEAHHGRVEVESELGVGTCFFVYLPDVAPDGVDDAAGGSFGFEGQG